MPNPPARWAPCARIRPNQPSYQGFPVSDRINRCPAQDKSVQEPGTNLSGQYKNDFPERSQELELSSRPEATLRHTEKAPGPQALQPQKC
jgi:hypothetical protein